MGGDFAAADLLFAGKIGGGGICAGDGEPGACRGPGTQRVCDYGEGACGYRGCVGTQGVDYGEGEAAVFDLGGVVLVGAAGGFSGAAAERSEERRVGKEC